MRNIFLSLLLIVFLLLLFAMVFGFSKNFYLREFSLYHPEKTLNINSKFVRYAGQVISEYLMGKRDNLQIPGFKNFFNEREIKHMDDVKRIFIWVKIISVLSLITFLIFLKPNGLPLVLLYSLILIAIILFIFLFLPFNLSFTKFHEILFNNELWLLNPETDRLIVLLPERFFIDATRGIILSTMFTLGSLLVIFKLIEKEKK